eukprot:11711633-Alexandrium_andersonii.AAC.1
MALEPLILGCPHGPPPQGLAADVIPRSDFDIPLHGPLVLGVLDGSRLAPGAHHDRRGPLQLES